MWFLVQGVRAQEASENLPVVVHEFPVVPRCFSIPYQALAELRDAAPLCEPGGCDGSTLLEVCKILFLLGTWEAGRRCVTGRGRPQPLRVDASSQTLSGKVIHLPLRKGIPSRDRILFSL